MSATPPIPELSDEMLAAVESELRTVVADLENEPQEEMGQMVHFHFGWTEGGDRQGGKRIRPLLSLLVCSAADGAWERAVPAAASIELIHNFSLIHDDIEDRSETRRGRPALWTEWGLAQALNTGDALLILSRTAAHRLAATGVPETTVLDVLEVLNSACLRLTIGQHLDLAFEQRQQVSEEEYLTMIAGKTSALLVGATAVGAHLGRADDRAIRSYSAFGHHLGMAFQIQDDILGIWGEPARTGKPASDDLLSRKKTLPVAFGLASESEFRRLWEGENRGLETVAAMRTALEQAGALEHARQLAATHTDKALQHLSEAQPAGPAAAELETLASALLGRDH